MGCALHPAFYTGFAIRIRHKVACVTDALKTFFRTIALPVLPRESCREGVRWEDGRKRTLSVAAGLVEAQRPEPLAGFVDLAPQIVAGEADMLPP
jgi:hypothetical protein